VNGLDFERLTPTERVVFQGKIQGQARTRIARTVGCAPNTIKYREQQIREKLGGVGKGRGWWIVVGRAYERAQTSGLFCDPSCACRCHEGMS
jgi:hypothetical protein